jgi:Uma2 family endonuclease
VKGRLREAKRRLGAAQTDIPSPNNDDELSVDRSGIAWLGFLREEERPMSKHAPPTRWTYAEFARLPDDGNRYEVIAGELYVSPAPRPLHQLVVTRITVALSAHVEANRMGTVFVGPIDVLFAEGDYLEPDVVFVRRERGGIESDRGLEAAPDLVVEVASPSTGGRDRILKRERYLHFGVPEYWVVDPEAREVLVYHSTGDPTKPDVLAETLTWRPFPSAPPLEIDIPALFRKP